MRELAQGVNAPEVGHLQRLLNNDNFTNGFPEPDLRVDCAFGPRTKARLEGWQAANNDPSGGRVTARTWHDLGQLTEIDHNVTLYAQPTSESCWSAAATMLFGDRSVGPGSARMVGAARRTGDLRGTAPHLIQASDENIRTFLTDAGLTYSGPQQRTIGELVTMLRRGPLWAAGRWRDSTGHGGHVVVISAVWADQAMTSTVTTFRVHDPWPPNRGAIYGAAYERGYFGALVRTGMTFNEGMLALAHR